jgi:hypothetical protein
MIVKPSDRSNPERQGGKPTGEWIIVSLLILLEASLVVLSLSLYKGFSSTSRTFIVGIAGVIGVMLPSLYLGRIYIKGDAVERRLFSLIVAMNLVTIVLIGLFAELIVRMNVRPNSQGVEVFGTTLIPKDWHSVRIWNRRLLEENPQSLSYLIVDDMVGWTVARNRMSKDGTYMSSREGIRSGALDVSYDKSKRSHRVVAVGDSFTFGLGVPFQSSWGTQLENKLGNIIEVLNFGVDGYGIDQAYLRYHRDAKAFHADLVVFSFVEWDLLRAIHVYPFVGLPDWEIPFAKPRFAMLKGKLELLNVPLMKPNNLLDFEAVTSLPFLEYESGYAAEEWGRRWYHSSALVRYLLSKVPRWPRPSSLTSEDTMILINAEILVHFVREVEAAGSIPLLVYLPSRTDFTEEKRRLRELFFGALQARGLRYADLTSCMKHGVYNTMFIEGDPHYSSEGNARAADCLKPIIQERLGLGG